ncbi:hypothetical protein JF110_001872 [Campylobacter jejuni]|nr:hypothetical protein [Campylobacter jejuni]
MKNDILIYKWGRPTDAFVPTQRDNPHKGRGFDTVVEYMARYLKNTCFMQVRDIEICAEGRNGEVEIPSDYIRIERSDEGFRSSKANKIIVLGGPDNEEFNRSFVNYINNTFKGDLYLFTNDHKFLELKGITKKYKILTELSNSRPFKSQYEDKWLEAEANLGFNPWLAKEIYFSTKSDSILILANELHSDYKHSRIPRIEEYCKANPNLIFDLYGLYEDPVNIDKLKDIKNLNFYNAQYTHKDLYRLMREYKYSLIIQASECEGSVYNKHILYPTNYICLKFYEYLLNDVVPFVDYTYKNLKYVSKADSDVIPDDLKISEFDKLSKAVDNIDKQYTAPFMNIGIVDTPAKSMSIRVNNILITKASADVFNVIFKEDAGF